MVYKVVWCNMLDHMGPPALHSVRRTKKSWLSVLLKDMGVMTGTRTHPLLIRNTRVFNR